MNIVICTSQPEESRYLFSRINRFFEARGERMLMFAFSSGEELLEYLAVSPDVPDAAIMSLQLPDMEARAFAFRLTERWGKMKLVLTGPSPGDVEELFAVGVSYYLYTPFEEGRFDRFSARLSAMLLGGREKIFQVSTKRGVSHIAYSDILYVMSDRRKIIIYQPNGVTDELYMKLDDMEETLDDRFVRSHKSYLVNMDYIHGITAEEFSLAGGITVPISQKRYWPAKRQYVNYVMRKG